MAAEYDHKSVEGVFKISLNKRPVYDQWEFIINRTLLKFVIIFLRFHVWWSLEGTEAAVGIYKLQYINISREDEVFQNATRYDEL